VRGVRAIVHSFKLAEPLLGEFLEAVASYKRMKIVIIQLGVPSNLVAVLVATKELDPNVVPFEVIRIARNFFLE
jgi:hypothetical protein